jgi:hypothetical protein
MLASAYPSPGSSSSCSTCCSTPSKPCPRRRHHAQPARRTAGQIHVLVVASHARSRVVVGLPLLALMVWIGWSKPDRHGPRLAGFLGGGLVAGLLLVGASGFMQAAPVGLLCLLTLLSWLLGSPSLGLSTEAVIIVGFAAAGYLHSTGQVEVDPRPYSLAHQDNWVRIGGGAAGVARRAKAVGLLARLKAPEARPGTLHWVTLKSFRVHDSAGREHRRNAQQQVDVIRPDVSLQDLDVIRLTECGESALHWSQFRGRARYAQRNPRLKRIDRAPSALAPTPRSRY